jgi:hypothetical protein
MAARRERFTRYASSEVAFQPAELPPGGVIAPDAALARLRVSGVTISRDPDRLQFGVAGCATRVVICTVRIEGANRSDRFVWLIEWTRDHRAPDYGAYFVDAYTGALLSGVGGDESATPLPR